MLKIKTALVTGATGFIGRRLVDELLKNKIHVGVLRRRTNIANTPTEWTNDTVSMFTGDMYDHATLNNICVGYDVVFHLAGYAHADDSNSDKADSKHWKTTVDGTSAMLHEAVSAGVQRFIFVSTTKARGESNVNCEDEIGTDHPLTCYGRAKLAAEKIVLEASESQRIQTAVLRLPLVYGAGNKGNIPRMIAAIDQGRFPPLLHLHNKRSMVHVDDVVQALLLIADQPIPSGNVYVVTDGQIYSTSDIYVAICCALGKTPPTWSMPIWVLRTGAILGDLVGKILGRNIGLNSFSLEKLLGSACYKSDKIQRELNFKPRHNLYDALPEMIADYRARNQA